MSSLPLRFSHKLQCRSDVLALHFTSSQSLEFKSTLCETLMHKRVIKQSFYHLVEKNDLSSVITFWKIIIIRISAVLPVTDALQDVLLSSALILTYQTHQTDKCLPLKLDINQKTTNRESRSASTGASPPKQQISVMSRFGGGFHSRKNIKPSQFTSFRIVISPYLDCRKYDQRCCFELYSSSFFPVCPLD